MIKHVNIVLLSILLVFTFLPCMNVSAASCTCYLDCSHLSAEQKQKYACNYCKSLSGFMLKEECKGTHNIEDFGDCICDLNCEKEGISNPDCKLCEANKALCNGFAKYTKCICETPCRNAQAAQNSNCPACSKYPSYYSYCIQRQGCTCSISCTLDSSSNIYHIYNKKCSFCARNRDGCLWCKGTIYSFDCTCDIRCEEEISSDCAFCKEIFQEEKYGTVENMCVGVVKPPDIPDPVPGTDEDIIGAMLALLAFSMSIFSLVLDNPVLSFILACSLIGICIIVLRQIKDTAR